MKQQPVSGSDISWAKCKFAPHCGQTTTAVPSPLSFFTGRMPFLPQNQQRQSTEGKNMSNEPTAVLKVTAAGAITGLE